MSSQGSFSRFVVTSIILFAFAAVGYFAGQKDFSPKLEATAHASALPAWESATRGKQMSLATGRIEDGIEALFGLDHLTGDLFCWVLNQSTGELASTFRTNAAAALGVEGDADFVLCTGLMDFRISRSGSGRISHSVIYVGDGNSGNIVGYSLVYNPQAIGKGNSDAGELKQIAQMITRDPRAVRNQGSLNGK